MTLHAPAIKLFVGYKITPDLKALLGPLPTLEKKTKLSHTYYESKEYIGLYLSSPKPTLEQIKKTQHTVNTALKPNCPELNLETLPLVVFPQVFLA